MDKHYKAKKIEYAHCDWICAIAMHRHSIVSAGGFFDRFIKVRTRSGRRLRSLKGHTGPRSVLLIPDFRVVLKDCIEITKFVRGISLVKAEYEKHIQNFMLKLFSTTRFAGSKLMLDAITKDGVYKALKEVAKKN